MWQGMRQDNNMSPLDTDSGSNSSENLSDLSSCTASDSEPSPNSTACTDAGGVYTFEFIIGTFALN